MSKSAVSWILVGILGFVWWWTGHRWDYLNSDGNQWNSIFTLVTLVSLVVLVQRPRMSPSGMLDGLTATVTGFLPILPWIVLAIVVLRGVAWLFAGAPAEPVDHFIRAIAATLIASLTTALWYGAIVNGTRSS